MNGGTALILAARLFLVALVVQVAGCEASRSGVDPLIPESTARIDDRHALGSHTCAGDDERRFLKSLNEIRTTLQAPPALCLEELGAFAEELAPHAPGESGYGEQRARVARRAGLAFEHFWLAELREALADDRPLTTLLRNPGHRTVLLSPQLRYLALRRDETGAVLATAMIWRAEGERLAPVVFPTEDLHASIPPSIEPREAGLTVDGAPMGFPISVHFPRFVDPSRGAEPQLTVRRFKLFEKVEGEGFVEVPALIRSRRSRAYLGGGDLTLLPKAPMRPLARYFVEFEGRYGDIHLEQSWFFQTSGSEPLAPKSLPTVEPRLMMF